MVFCQILYIADGDLVHVIPSSLSYEQAALTQNLRLLFMRIRQSALKTGDTAVIFGRRSVRSLKPFRAAGASKIYAVELSRTPRNEEFGAIVVRARRRRNNRRSHPSRLAIGG